METGEVEQKDEPGDVREYDETDEIIDELARRLSRLDVWIMAITVVLAAAVVAAFFIAAFWDELCARIMLDALNYGVRQLPTR